MSKVAPLSIQEQKEIFIREDGSTFTRDDIFVKLSVSFRDHMLAALKGPPLSVYLCIALHCGNSDMESWPSTATIEKETAYSHPAVSKAIKDLVAAGLIKVIRRHKPDGSWKTNLYQVNGYASMGKDEQAGNKVTQDGQLGEPKEETSKEETSKEETVAPAAPLAAPPLPSRGKESTQTVLSTPGVTITKNLMIGEMAEVFAEGGDTQITCPLCDHQQGWPSSETQRRKDFNLTCQIGEGGPMAGCGAFFLVHAPKARTPEGPQVIYEHKQVKNMTGWTATFNGERIPMSYHSFPVSDEETALLLYEEMKANPELVINKLRWASQQGWLKYKRDRIIHTVLTAVHTAQKKQSTPKPAAYTDIPDEKLVVEWFGSDDD